MDSDFPLTSKMASIRHPSPARDVADRPSFLRNPVFLRSPELSPKPLPATRQAPTNGSEYRSTYRESQSVFGIGFRDRCQASLEMSPRIEGPRRIVRRHEGVACTGVDGERHVLTHAAQLGRELFSKRCCVASHRPELWKHGYNCRRVTGGSGAGSRAAGLALARAARRSRPADRPHPAASKQHLGGVGGPRWGERGAAPPGGSVRKAPFQAQPLLP
jgi:hypothetical protein